jgi:hypothetical protein
MRSVVVYGKYVEAVPIILQVKGELRMAARVLCAVCALKHKVPGYWRDRDWPAVV